MQDEGWLVNEEKATGSGQYYEVYHTNINYDGEQFTAHEMEVLNTITTLFKNKKTDQIVELSHEERAWINNEQDRSLINYQQYAFDLLV